MGLVIPSTRPPVTPPAVPLVEELSPAPEPWQVFRSLQALPILFLDSALRHPSLGRYSFLTADPFECIWARGSRVWVQSEQRPREPADPIAVLAVRLRCYGTDKVPCLPTVQAGAAGM